MPLGRTGLRSGLGHHEEHDGDDDDPQHDSHDRPAVSEAAVLIGRSSLPIEDGDLSPEGGRVDGKPHHDQDSAQGEGRGEPERGPTAMMARSTWRNVRNVHRETATMAPTLPTARRRNLPA